MFARCLCVFVCLFACAFGFTVGLYLGLVLLGCIDVLTVSLWFVFDLIFDFIGSSWLFDVWFGVLGYGISC